MQRKNPHKQELRLAHKTDCKCCGCENESIGYGRRMPRRRTREELEQEIIEDFQKDLEHLINEGKKIYGDSFNLQITQ